MALMTPKEEYDAIREALQTFATGASIFQFSLGDMNITYRSDQTSYLQAREKELARQLTQRNIRKRTRPDFS